MLKLDKTESLVTIGDMAYVREVNETDFCNCMCVNFQFDTLCVFLSLFQLEKLLCKEFNAFKAYILLLHVFFLTRSLTRMQVRVTHFTWCIRRDRAGEDGRKRDRCDQMRGRARSSIKCIFKFFLSFSK